MRMFNAIATAVMCIVAPALTLPVRQASAQEATRSPLEFPVEANAVNLSVSVTDNGGNPIQGLTRDDFVVYENSVRQDIVIFEPQELPLRVILLVDVSPSLSYMSQEARKAAESFIEVLRPQDQAAVKAFSSVVFTLQELTDDHALLKEAIEGIATQEKQPTKLYDAVYTIAREFGVTAPSILERRIVILVTDGEDLYIPEERRFASRNSAEGALQAAERSGITFYPIMIPNPIIAPWHPRELTETASEFLNELRRRTYGTSVGHVEGRFTVDDAYRTIRRDLETRYRIGYIPTHQRDPGPDRNIIVQIKGSFDRYALNYRKQYFLK